MARIGIYLAVVQLLFATCWTVYALFLPALAARAGIAATAVPWILLVDQVIFAATDLAMGVAADRLARAHGRLALVIAGVTLVSCAAFLLLPLVAGAAPLLAVIFVWSATTAALRAPTFTLLGKYAARPAQATLASLALVGLGLAGAIGPALTVALRDQDPRLPFALASLVLALATAGIVRAERRLAAQAPAAPEAPAQRPAVAAFLAGAALLALGFQVHFFLNSAPLYLRFGAPKQLPYLMPIFWVGFTLILPLASRVARRAGGLVLIASGCAIGALASRLAAGADSLGVEIAAQLVAGAAWGSVLMAAIAAALAVGSPGREGRVTGALFAVLAAAALARIAVVATGSAKTLAAVLDWTPAGAWIAAALLVAVLALRAARRTR
jgi:hypothetical protein